MSLPSWVMQSSYTVIRCLQTTFLKKCSRKPARHCWYFRQVQAHQRLALFDQGAFLHQAIVEHFGGVVGRAGETVHGKTASIHVAPHPVFTGLPNPFSVARYHSLMATELPNALTCIGMDRHIPMAIIHEQQRMLGFQFHPESILTTLGKPLLQQSIRYLLRSDT